MGLNDPEQIHLALGAAGEMYVSWVTGVYVQSATPPVTPTPTVQTQVGLGWIHGAPMAVITRMATKAAGCWHVLTRKASRCVQVKYGLSPGNLNLLATGQVVYYTTNNTGTPCAQLC